MGGRLHLRGQDSCVVGAHRLGGGVLATCSALGVGLTVTDRCYQRHHTYTPYRMLLLAAAAAAAAAAMAQGTYAGIPLAMPPLVILLPSFGTSLADLKTRFLVSAPVAPSPCSSTCAS